MLRWLLEEWFARFLRVSILPRDARHRYVSPAGTAYDIDVTPVPGVLAAVEVTLRGEPAIKGTALPGLTLIVRPTALRVGAAIRYLLHQADFESRLEHIVDVPKGKIIYHLSNTNPEKAKAILGDTVCLAGSVPNILLLSGTPDDVRAYCKRLIDVVGKDGGFIMDSAIMLDEAKPENLKAMFDYTREYGVYR